MSGTTGGIRWLAAVIAVVAWFGVLLQLYISLGLAFTSGQTIIGGLNNYFGFFTIWTNLLVALALTFPLLAPSSAPGRFFARPAAIGWVATSILFVGISYYVLLRKVWMPQGLQFVADVTLHYVVPILFVIYSLIVLRGIALRWVSPLWWALYPIVYFIFALVRGAISGKYPYGFINATALGYPVAFLNGCLLGVAYAVLGYLLILIWRSSGTYQSTRQNTALR